ncbi:MAG: ferritin-like domain-containing protein [Candidatus Cellulosilyticum pullistercoris]|uniref:Ferritin-like domain-containing protein n=1 Tax=Candidatus Cellulosilyticum pullistercoris TaxID=2838521 RepID=A0A9E2KE14_9FIRM|nr:ferritin-like domain-containing protein [Candidatus Cellulosilyticum pullistercoris]
MRQTYPSTAQFKEAINLINSSIENEQADAMFYMWLIQNIPTDLEESQRVDIAQTIQGIANDEKLHNEILKSMYRQLTGTEAQMQAQGEPFEVPNSFEEGVVKALKGEVEAVRKYRKIMAGMPDNSYRDQVFSILTDELRHGILYNYIYTTIQSM